METIGNRWALVLAAGDGTRLRALTTARDGVAVPKQFCSLDGGATLLERTVCRARRLVAEARIVAVVAAEHGRWWNRDLALPSPNVIIQPRNRGTAAGILLPLLAILERDPEARIVVVPSDHFVAREGVLARAARQAMDLVDRRSTSIVLLGIAPDAADGEYGWIVPGAPETDGSFRVASFVEKPGPVVAGQLLERGGLWNSFVFAATAATLIRLFAVRLPAVLAQLKAARRSGRIGEVYETLATADFSRQVLQGAEGVLRVIRVPSCGWSDLGTPERVARCLADRPERRRREFRQPLPGIPPLDLRAQLQRAG